MDERIFCYRLHAFFDNPDSLYERLYNALHRDDKDEYLRLLQDPEFEEMRSSFYAQQVFEKDAVNIATAVLNGETKGIIDIQDDLDGATPLHLAASTGAPKITKYLIQRGDNVDVMCDYPSLNLKKATPLDIAVENAVGYDCDNVGISLFRMIVRFCLHKKHKLEAIRLLVQRSENKERVRQAFIGHAHMGQLAHLVALFLAVPELFVLPYTTPLGVVLSPFSILYLEVNSLKKKTDIQEALSLLLDVFALIGDKLVAYIRLEETREKDVYERETKIRMGLDFLVREAASKKLGGSTSDYYFRFFQPLIPKASDKLSEGYLPGFHDCTFGLTLSKWYVLYPTLLSRKEFDTTDIYRVLPKIDDKIAGRVDRAIKKKLASLSTLQRCFEALAKISNTSNTEEKHPLRGLSFPYGTSLKRPGFAFISTLPKKVMKPVCACKPTLTNEVMKPVTLTSKVITRPKLNSFFSTRGLYYASIIARRVIN